MNGPNRNQNNRPKPAPNSHNRNQRKPGEGGQERQADGNRRPEGNRGGQQQGGRPNPGQQRSDGPNQNQNKEAGGGNNRNRRGKRNRNRPGGGGQGGPGGQPGQQNKQSNPQQGKQQGNKGPGQKQQRPEAKPIKLQPDFKEIPNKHQIKKYGVIFFETLAAAKADLEALAAKADGYDQYNVIVRAEANMDDPDFNKYPKLKLFAGAAWTLIHERRNEEGWYDAPR